MEIEEVWPFVKSISEIWYSHKFNGPGLRYEIGVCIISGDIVWVNRPFPCGMFSDYMIFKMGIRHYLKDNERLETE